MAKAQPNQDGQASVENPKSDPIILTEDLSSTSISQSVEETQMIKKEVETDITQPITAEMDKKLSHEKRVVAYLEKRHTGDFIKLNDFLKSLYPIPKPNEKPIWMQQGAMRKLRQDLLAMRDRGEVVFSNNNPERLGDNYHVGEQRIRKDYNIGDFPIEAKLSY